MRYVVDQARAWTDAGGRGVRRYLRWAAYQAAEGRASDTILPELDHDAVRVMTVHAAKGLEFPITVVSGLTTEVQRQHGRCPSCGPATTWALAEKGNELFEDYKPLDEQMGDAERRRLLYVACTRAVDHLVVSLHRKPENVADGTAKATERAPCWPARARPATARRALDAGADAARARRRRAARAAVARRRRVGRRARRGRWPRRRVRSTTSATGLAVALDGDGHAIDGGAAPTARRPRAWPRTASTSTCRRGSAGATARPIGRAVHAVLQDADLATGDDIDVLAAAQCAAEGIFGLEARVADAVPLGARRADRRRRGRRAPSTGASCSSSPSSAARCSRATSTCSCAPRRASSSSTTRPTSGGPAPTRPARVARYRHQLAAYGVALGRLLDEPIAGGVLVRCRPDGPAEQIALDGWADALAEVVTAPVPRPAVLTRRQSGRALGRVRVAARTSRGSAAVRDHRA